jgi:hypothetical protein
MKEVIVTPKDEIPKDHDMIESQEQEKSILGKGTYSICIEVWCPRRNHETKQET